MHRFASTGKLPWARLFDSAIDYAENGHPVAVIKAFTDGGVEGAMLLELDRQDLETDMKIEPATCTRIFKEIKDLQRDAGLHSSSDGADESTALPPSINRFDYSRGVSP